MGGVGGIQFTIDSHISHRFSSNVFDTIGKVLGLKLKVGYPKEVKELTEKRDEYDGLSTIEVALRNNYGTYEIPERNFMDQANGLINERYRRKDFEKVLESMIMFGSESFANSGYFSKQEYIDNVLKQFGEMGVAIIKEVLDNTPSWATENAEKTIKSKKKRGVKPYDKPLFDSGHLRDSATYYIVKAHKRFTKNDILKRSSRLMNGEIRYAFRSR